MLHRMNRFIFSHPLLVPALLIAFVSRLLTLLFAVINRVVSPKLVYMNLAYPVAELKLAIFKCSHWGFFACKSPVEKNNS